MTPENSSGPWNVVDLVTWRLLSQRGSSSQWRDVNPQLLMISWTLGSKRVAIDTERLKLDREDRDRGMRAQKHPIMNVCGLYDAIWSIIIIPFPGWPGSDSVLFRNPLSSGQSASQ